MPNGDDKNLIRLLGAIEGFRVRHGTWPTRVRIYPRMLQNIREHLLSPESFAKLTEKVQLIADEAPVVAEDDQGNSYSYGAEGFLASSPDPRARDWLGLSPNHGG
jgi:hypothetical protein